MRLKKQFLHLYCNSNKKGFLTRNKIEITAMAFNDFSDRGKPDSMIGGCALSGEECFSLLQGQTVVSVFDLQKVHIASGFACNENAVHPLFLAAARLNGIVQKIAQHRTQFHIGKRHLIRKIEPHLKFCPLYLRHAVVVFNQRIYDGIFTERNIGVTLSLIHI